MKPYRSSLKTFKPLLIIVFLTFFCAYGCETPATDDDAADADAIELPPIAQVGVVVRNLDRAVEHYTKLGLGPFHVMEVEVEGFIYKGKPAPHKLKLGMSMGTPQIELIQTLEGETPNTDFLKRKGEGISHYGINVSLEQFEAIKTAWAKQGIRPIFYRDEPERRIAYFNTQKVGGAMIELVGANM